MSIRNRDAAIRGIVVVAVAMLAIAIGAIGLTLWALRHDAAEDAARHTANIATVLAEQTSRTVQAIDIMLDDLRERISETNTTTVEEFRGLVTTRDYHNFLIDRLSRLPQAVAFGIVDSTGEVQNSTRRWPTPKVDVSDRDYFTAHLHDIRDRLFVSRRQKNRANGAWSVQFSRRIYGGNGEFLGVAYVSVETAFFNEIFGSIETLHNQKITLANRDGTLIVEHPAPSTFTSREMPADSEWLKLVAGGGGHARIVDDADGEAWLTAVRPLMSYPLVIGVGISEDSAYATWRRRAMFIATGTLLILICSMFLLRALLRQLRQLFRSEQSLAAGKSSLAEKTVALERANLQIDAALNNITQGVCMFDENGRIVVFNQRYLEMYGLSPEVVKPGCSLTELITHRKNVGLFDGDVKRYCDDIVAAIRSGKTSSQMHDTTDGRTIHVVQQPIGGGGWVVTHEDVTERKRAERQTAFMARHDALTGLANRLHLLERIDQKFAVERENGGMFAVFALDLDLFKAVNDSLGHPTGDALLKQVATRLRDSTGDDVDIIARLGGDEFVLVQSVSGRQREKAVILANRLLEDVSAPYEIEGHQIVIGTSIGIALAPSDGDDAGELLKHADLALYRVKSEGRNGYRFFEQEMDDEAQSRHVLQGDLRESLVRKEFELHFQTLFDAKTRLACGAEALVRWRHPVKGMIPPTQFIQLAEEIGVIVPLGEWILAEACRIAVTWPEHIKIAVNLSPAQFRSPNLVDMVANVLAETDLAPDRLELEITESVLLQKNANNLTTLYQLKSLGLSIVLDDFGTGYSSLSYLRMFPFDKIKIDRSFVCDLSTRADCAAIVCAVVGLGHGLNIVTTAEGVETEEQFRLLRAAGVNQMQGYLLSRPRPPCDLEFREIPDSMEAA